MVRKIAIYCAIAILALFAASCRGKKERAAISDAQSATMPMPELYGALEEGYRPWADVQAPVSIRISAPADFSISGRATMARDSSIYISLRKMGFEVAIISIDADSVRLIDKYHKAYVAEPATAIFGSRIAGIGEAQSLLMGQAFASAAGGALGFIADGSPRSLGGLEFAGADGDVRVAIRYADPAATPAGQAASTVALSAATPLANVEASLHWNFDKASWDTGKRQTAKTPKGYQRISLADILAMIANQQQ